MNTPITNIAAYLFVSIEDIETLKDQLQQRCQALALKGTILIASEGINLFLAGLQADIEAFLLHLKADSRFARLEVKFSYSEQQPFKKMLVKKKKEIITMKRPIIRPEEGRAPGVEAKTLSKWLSQGQDDEKRPVVLIDTRNAFETDFGSFENAIDYRIDKFSDFPEIIESKADEFRGKTVVTFCTGGIRCEKAAILMQRAGFERVYQLDGGILKYFEEAGDSHYQGSCFVFDEREALNPDLRATAQHELATRPEKA
ncbi:MAG: sulfurtransferase [Burkholderiales bacterium]|jgi:UPF0176 protein|nr:sulfurtransferase [Burkholderiales bacterium]